MQFDFYANKTKGKAVSDLLVLIALNFVTIYGFMSYFETANFLQSIISFVASLYFNIFAWFVCGYKYLNRHHIMSAEGCLTLYIMMALRFIASPFIGAIYYPYIVVSAIKRIFTK